MMNQSCLSLRQRFLRWSVVLIFVITNIALFAQPAHAQSMWVVDDDGQASAADCDASQSAFNSIQDAVDAASPGDTIFICPGIYDEQVVVRKNNLTIMGSGVGATVLRPSVVTQNTIRPGTTFTAGPILVVNEATGVTVANLTIDGSAAADGGAANLNCGVTPFYVGIYYRNGSGTVDSTHVTNIRSSSHCSFAILAQSGPGGVADLVANANLLDHYGTFGMNCNGFTTSCTITENVIRGEGPVDDAIQGGIVIRLGAVATIAGNVITDHFFRPAHGVPQFSVGIFLVFADPSTNPHLLRDNTFANNQLNVQRFSTEEVVD